MKSKGKNLPKLTDIIKISYKSIVFVLLIAGYVLTTLVVNLAVRDQSTRLRKLSAVASFFSSLALRVLKVSVNVIDDKNLQNADSALIVSNHLSYLDIFITSSIIPSVFIAGIDGVQENFLIGGVTKLSGSIFVERKTRSSLSNDIRAISDILPHNINLVLYPEGTTTDGSTVYPFKSSLFLPAVEAEMYVLALCFKYRKINGKDIDASNRDNVLFYGNMEFFPHIFNLMTLDSIEIDVHIIDLVRSSEYTDRKHLRDITYEKILNCYETD